MRTRYVTLPCVIVACSAPAPTPPDPCADMSLVASGSAEVGLGSDFAPIVDGQDVTLQLGVQGLWMFVVNVRVTDLDVGSGAMAAAVNFNALDQSGAPVAVPVSCRVREFGESADGSSELTSAYLLPLQPSETGAVNGAMVTLTTEVNDIAGNKATDSRTIVAHIPSQ